MSASSLSCRLLCVVMAMSVAPVTLLRAEDKPATKVETGKEPSGKEPAAAPKKLEACELGAISKIHRLGDIYLAGQPSADDFATAKKAGVKTVINLRTAPELDWDEAGTVRKLGLEYHHLPFRAPETFKDEILDDARKLLKEKKNRPVILHCASANRVGAIWLAYRVLDEGVKWDDALAEAKKVGLSLPAYEDKVRDYVQRNQKAGAR